MSRPPHVPWLAAAIGIGSGLVAAAVQEAFVVAVVLVILLTLVQRDRTWP